MPLGRKAAWPSDGTARREERTEKGSEEDRQEVTAEVQVRGWGSTKAGWWPWREEDGHSADFSKSWK